MTAQRKMTWWTLVILLVLGSGAGWQLFASGGDEINYNFAAVSKAGYFVWIVLYLSAGICIALGFDDLQRAVRRDVLAIALLSFVVLSASWSQMPGYALYTALQLVFVSLFAMVAGEQLSRWQAWSAAAIAFAVIIAASLFFALALPHLGIVQATQNKGAWRGAFLEKNIFGTYLVLASATAFVGVMAFRGWKRRMAFGAWIVCILLLLPSRATTALLIALSIPFAAFALHVVHAPRARAYAALGIALPAIAVAIAAGLLFSTSILDLIGKDSSLTGRDELWEYALKAIQERPFGFGFGSFWDEAGPWGGVDLTRSIIWRPRSAHNVWVETSLQLGLLGAFLFLAFMLQSFYRAGRLVARRAETVTVWPALILYVLLCFGSVETNMLIHQSVSHVLLFLVTACIARELDAQAVGAQLWRHVPAR